MQLPELSAGVLAIAKVTGLMLTLMAAGLAIERIRPADKQQTWAQVGLNIAYLPVYLLTIFVFAPWVAALLPHLPEAAALATIAWGNTWWGTLAQLALFAAAYDFFYYWWHRAQHAFPALWALHELHHSERALNVTSAVRHHWFDETVRPLVVLLPLSLLLTFSPVAFPYIAMAFAAWPLFIHMNIRWRLGAARYLLVSPQYHRIHHSTQSEHFNKNFGAFTPLWDMLFGTVHFGDKDTYPPTGIEGNSGRGRDAVKSMLRLPLPVRR